MEETKAIEVKGLTSDYHGEPVLHGVDLSVKSGERVGVVGPNGAGKTTLLLHLAGLLFGRGSISLDGISVEPKNLSMVRRKMGLVFSDPEDQLFMPTLEEDAAFGPLNLGLSEEEALRLARESLTRMGLFQSKDRSSHHLSDGEQRRAAIATILAMNPSIWLLDEPTANLDPRGRRELISTLRALSGTVLVASHDLDLVVQVCGRCWVMDQGVVVADGPTKEVLADALLMEKHGLEVPWCLCSSAKNAQRENAK
jgi:cobalt/nickel transport system ATP-binding protein